MRLTLAILATCALAACSPLSGASVPASESTTQPANKPLHLQGRVSDAAGILPADAEGRISRTLQRLEEQSKHQMVVATMPSLGNEDIAEYTKALGNRWGIGRKGINDGVVILVAPNERKVRIAVGDGLRSALPDAFCKQVIDEQIIPRFKAGHFADGIESGVSALAARIGQ